jgi:hypothetical protein
MVTVRATVSDGPWPRLWPWLRKIKPPRIERIDCDRGCHGHGYGIFICDHDRDLLTCQGTVMVTVATAQESANVVNSRFDTFSRFVATPPSSVRSRVPGKKKCFLRPWQGLWADGGSSMSRRSDDLLANYGRKYVFFSLELGPLPRTPPQLRQFQQVCQFQSLRPAHAPRQESTTSGCKLQLGSGPPYSLLSSLLPWPYPTYIVCQAAEMGKDCSPLTIISSVPAYMHT